MKWVYDSNSIEEAATSPKHMRENFRIPEHSVVVAQRDGSDQRWGVAVKKFKGGRYLSLSRGIPVVVPF